MQNNLQSPETTLSKKGCFFVKKRYNEEKRLNLTERSSKMQMQSIDDFIESILKDKGITDIEPEVKADLIEEMKTRLMDQINKAAVMQLSEEKAAELAEKVKDPEFTNEKITEFMQNSGVNLTQITLDTMLKFRSLYLGTEA